MGALGTGKSQAGNFFFKKKVFKSDKGWTSVTTKCASYTGIVGNKSITITDTRGFLEPLPKNETELAELKDSLSHMPKKTDAIGFVINAVSRVNIADVDLHTELLEMNEAIPYVFLVFTHAKGCGETEKDQEKDIESKLNDTSKCPKGFQLILKRNGNRYMLLESVQDMEQGYHERKSQELIQIVQEIMKQTKKAFCGIFHVFALLKRVADREAVVPKPEDLRFQDYLATLFEELLEMVVKNKILVVASAVIVIIGFIILGFLWVCPSTIKKAVNALTRLGEETKLEIGKIIRTCSALKPSEIKTHIKLAYEHFKQVCSNQQLLEAFEKALSFYLILITSGSGNISAVFLLGAVPIDVRVAINERVQYA